MSLWSGEPRAFEQPRRPVGHQAAQRAQFPQAVSAEHPGHPVSGDEVVLLRIALQDGEVGVGREDTVSREPMGAKKSAILRDLPVFVDQPAKAVTSDD
ncbi:hypothetical protein [Nonomuraea sp. NPDC005650]|uniref:hypothetical protein n=1 Tax=Nonomuraea sp. NPDC005650 TaxID=3157045 RepID=UPI0033BF638B